jgi:transcription elongation GreA/GreB family factor
MAIYTTSGGKRALEEELRYLKNVVLKAIQEEMDVSISMGDLHEYHEAKAVREKTLTRIAELEEMLQKIVVLDTY